MKVGSPNIRALALSLAVGAGTLAPAAALAHELLHELRRGNAVAVRVYESDGEAVGGSEFEVFSPAAPKVPFQRGRTDPHGWLSFVPDAPGKWRVKVLAEGGHGLELEVDAGQVPTGTAPDGASGWAFALRPVLGVAAISLVFAVLFLAYRAQGRRP